MALDMPFENIILPRRAFLTGVGAAALAAGLPRVVLADAPTDKRFVVIILRGAMDGLNVVPPYGDKDYAALRAQIAIAKPGETDGAFDLNGFFGLHPALAEIAPWYKEGALLPIHAVASPYRDRSHFDGQDVLENGTLSARDTESGWLNRALTAMGGSDRRIGLAVGQSIPLVLRGPTPVASWAPTHMPEANDSFLTLVQAVYQGDQRLSAALADGIRATAAADHAIGTDNTPIASAGMVDDGKPAPYRGQEALAEAAGKMLADPNGPRIAAFDAQGWDTHAAQGGAKGRLAQALGGLQASLVALRRSLGPAWKDTVVLMATEFGRTAHVNGTNGTDHGTGTVTLLAGGAVAGGKVAGQWPGLADGQLYQSRDLMPTTDLRAVMKTVLAEHMGVPRDRLDGFVFPNSSDARTLKGIVAA
ncbi:MAG TPA: DUF1501 domain-containing protein [Alphaproteobacteria bacterium]|jgi:uncharacterized protein (DUF1501 family)|nr:DUF1501 domain-containing protein [Alphaproteobacteria bacterium]